MERRIVQTRREHIQFIRAVVYLNEHRIAALDHVADRSHQRPVLYAYVATQLRGLFLDSKTSGAPRSV